MFFKDSSACFGNSDTLLCSSFQTPWCSNISKCDTEIVARKMDESWVWNAEPFTGHQKLPSLPSCLMKILPEACNADKWPHCWSCQLAHREAPLVWPGDKEELRQFFCTCECFKVHFYLLVSLSLWHFSDEVSHHLRTWPSASAKKVQPPERFY